MLVDISIKLIVARYDYSSGAHDHGGGVPEAKVADVAELHVDGLLKGDIDTDGDNETNSSVNSNADGDGNVNFDAYEGFDTMLKSDGPESGGGKFLRMLANDSDACGDYGEVEPGNTGLVCRIVNPY